MHSFTTQKVQPVEWPTTRTQDYKRDVELSLVLIIPLCSVFRMTIVVFVINVDHMTEFQKISRSGAAQMSGYSVFRRIIIVALERNGS